MRSEPKVLIFVLSRYTDSGEFLEELSQLNEARLGLACSSFADQNGDIVSWIFSLTTLNSHGAPNENFFRIIEVSRSQGDSKSLD